MRVRRLEFFYRSLDLLVFIFFINIVFAQQVLVVDEQNMPMEAVWIYTEPESSSLFTDSKGKAQLPDQDSEVIFYFEHLGYVTQKQKLGDLEKNNWSIKMKAQSELLEEVTVVGRLDRRTRDIISETAMISNRNIKLENPQTTADAIFKSGEAFIQKSQMGGGSPVLRGFEANRVLLVVDGVRMNNAIYRNGHLQNAISIDPSMLSNIELIFGPASLSYGSDALGGVIHFRTLNPVFNLNNEIKAENKLNYKFRYASANMEKTGHLSWNLGWKNIAFLTGVSYSDFGDLRAGSKRPEAYPEFGKRSEYVHSTEGEDRVEENSNPNIQKGTSYSQLDVFQKIKIRFSRQLKMTTNIQYSASSDIPRYDFLTEMNESEFKYGDWYYGPQKRFLGSVRLEYEPENLLFDKTLLIAAAQRIDEDRHFRKFKSTILESTQEDLWVYSLTADFFKAISVKQGLTYGLDAQLNKLSSKGEAIDILTNETYDAVFSRYPDESAMMNNYGGFINYNYSSSNFGFQTGIRLSRNEMDIAYAQNELIQWPEHFYSGIQNNNTALAYSFGFKYLPGQTTEIKLNLSSAFRTPNIDDLSKIRVKNDEILVPNPNLGAETAYNAELGIGTELNVLGSKHKIQLNTYVSLLENGIVRGDFQLPDGSLFYFDGDDKLKVKANINADRVLIRGIYLGVDGVLSKKWTYGSRINATYGSILEDGESRPAEHIPPLFGNLWLSYSSGKWQLKGSSIFNAWKHIEDYGGSVDNPDSATADGSYSWMIFNLGASYSLNEKVTINVAMENILDKHYRPFSSGVSAPGINGIISVFGKF